MQAYHNDAELKAKILAQMQAHIAADELIQGIGWENGRGCAIGCLFHEYNHELAPTYIGWPVNLSYLIDTIFERLSNGEAKQFIIDLIEAIPVGIDLDTITNHWLLWLLAESGVRDLATDEGKASIDIIVRLFYRKISGDIPTGEEWAAAKATAKTAAAAGATWAAEAAAWQSYAGKLIELVHEA